MSLTLLPAQAGTIPPVTTDMLVVFGIVLLALFLFVTEPLPSDITAIFIIVVLTLLSPWTNISVTEGISGFSSTATIAVLAMLVEDGALERESLGLDAAPRDRRPSNDERS